MYAYSPYMGTQKKMSLSIEFESWVSTQKSDSKLIKNELLDSNSDSKLIENELLNSKLKPKTHLKWVTQFKTQTQNSLKMRLKLNTQTHFFLSSHVCNFVFSFLNRQLKGESKSILDNLQTIRTFFAIRKWT